MAKGVGLDAGEFEVKVVELEGSYRKPRLTKANVDRVSQLSSSASDPVHATAEASALQHAVKDAHVSKQNVCLGFSSREALFRRLSVPFTGVERIRKVIKFEAEGEIHSQSVDDMVIDFHVIEERDGETRVIVAGVPKTALRTTLGALDKVGLEPEKVDLDSMGLYRVAEWCGALAPLVGDAEPADAESTGVAQSAGVKSRLILNIGARGVIVLVFSEGHLLDMRAIPMGCDSVAEDVAGRTGVSLDEAREAVIHALATGADYQVPDAEVDDDAEGEVAEGAERPLPVPTGRVIAVPTVTEARDRFLGRLRREFMRFLVSVKGVGEIEATFITGGGSMMPGMSELLAEVFGVETQPLAFMHLLQHGYDEAEAQALEPRIAVAVGLALGHFNGVKGFNFRQEDLVFTRGFDRVKLPLAIACMMALFFLFFHAIGMQRELQAKERIIGYPVKQSGAASSNRRSTGKAVTEFVQFTGYLTYLVNRGTWIERDYLRNENKYREFVNQLAAQPTFKRISWYYAKLTSLLKEAQREGQYEPSLALDSSTAVLQQFAGVVAAVEKRMGRFYIGELGIKLPTKKNGRTLTFRMFIRGADFRERNAILERAFEDQFADKTSAFEGFSKAPAQNPVAGESVGCYYSYSITLRERIPVKDLK